MSLGRENGDINKSYKDISTGSALHLHPKILQFQPMFRPHIFTAVLPQELAPITLWKGLLPSLNRFRKIQERYLVLISTVDRFGRNSLRELFGRTVFFKKEGEEQTSLSCSEHRDVIKHFVS